MRILITGGSGYIGSMLIHNLLSKEEVDLLYVIDIKKPKFLWQENEKIKFIKKNLVDDWEKEIDKEIDVIIHLAFHIRRPFWFWQLKKHLYENSFGFEKILKFAKEKNIKKIIVASSIAVYGAKLQNNQFQPFKEEDNLRENVYLYGKEKILMEKKAQEFSQKNPDKKLIILRLATVTGPFGQKAYRKKGLLDFFKNLAPFIPLTSNQSLRQYVHEDDVINSIIFVLFNNFEDNYLILNVAPSDFLYFSEIAKILNKKVVYIPYSIAKILFSLFWYLSLGKIPTSPGSINSYTFPIVVSNKKILSLGFKFEYSARDAFLGEKGKYSYLFSPKS